MRREESSLLASTIYWARPRSKPLRLRAMGLCLPPHCKSSSASG